jgi:arylsulfatase A-like enzyme
LNIDFAPTWADLAGVGAPGADGESLMPVLRKDPDLVWRKRFTIEHIESFLTPTYCAVRTSRFKMVEYETGELELYDIKNDPFELRNLDGDPVYAARVTSLRNSLHNLCDPAPPGMSWNP